MSWEDCLEVLNPAFWRAQGEKGGCLLESSHIQVTESTTPPATSLEHSQSLAWQWAPEHAEELEEPTPSGFQPDWTPEGHLRRSGECEAETQARNPGKFGKSWSYGEVGAAWKKARTKMKLSSCFCSASPPLGPFACWPSQRPTAPARCSPTWLMILSHHPVQASFPPSRLPHSQFWIAVTPMAPLMASLSTEFHLLLLPNFQLPSPGPWERDSDWPS